MPVSDDFFEDLAKKSNAISAFEKDTSEPSDSASENDQTSPESFLDSIGALAIRQRMKSSSFNDQPVTDLTTLSIKDFPEIDSTEKISRKIEELKSIIKSIEEKPSGVCEIELAKKYRIDYRNDLNKTQLEAVTTINGPVLVIAGAGSGKTRVIVHRVAFMLENEIDPGEILLLTFTRKASSEMIGRVQGLLNDNKRTKSFRRDFSLLFKLYPEEICKLPRDSSKFYNYRLGRFC